MYLRLFSTILTLILGGMPSIVLAQPCLSTSSGQICFGDIDSRGKLSVAEREMVSSGATLAIETLVSEGFAKSLDSARAKVDARPASTKKWRDAQASFGNLSNQEIISRLLTQINGMQIDTFGYSRGTWLWWVYGTKAMDGGVSGPILLNRAALYKASSESLANTIIHEAAHRIGLSHPNKASCEAPYLIGDLIQSEISETYELPCDA